MSFLKKDPFAYIKSNFQIIDDTSSIIPRTINSKADDENVNEKNNDKNKRKIETSVFDDKELLGIIKKDSPKQGLWINKNTKVQTNISMISNQEDSDCEFPCEDLNSKAKKNKKGNYLISLSNLKRKKMIDNFDNANVNEASMNNLNIIETKNNVNQVHKFFKKQIENQNNNIIFENHLMIPGMAEITKLTG